MKYNNDKFYEIIRNHKDGKSEKKLLVVLSGSGISKESGIPTFRDSVDGLWENFNVEEVATDKAMKNEPEKVHDFCNILRNKYVKCEPNDAHKLLADLEKYYDVVIITQNVDNLHEKAGSSNVLHLHGNLMQCRDSGNPDYLFDVPVDENGEYNTHKGMVIEGHPVRPHIVLFGEDVPNITVAQKIARVADIAIIVGTSLAVYPAAGLVGEIEYGLPVYYIDPQPCVDYVIYGDFNIVKKPATEGMKEVNDKLIPVADKKEDGEQ